MSFLDIFTFEVRRNLKIYSIWTFVWILIILGLLPFYDTFSSGSTDFGEIFQQLPDAFKVAFNINENTLSSITGYINTEMIEILILSASIFGVFVGVRSIGKEISNKSIHFLISKPVGRNSLYYAKFFNHLTLTIISNSIIFLFLSLSVQIFTDSTVPYEYINWAFIIISLYQLFYLSLGFTLGVLIDDGPAIGVGVLIVVATFMINIISKLSSDMQFLRFITPYNYLELTPLLNGEQISTDEKQFIFFVSVIILIVGAMIFYRKDIDT